MGDKSRINWSKLGTVVTVFATLFSIIIWWIYNYKNSPDLFTVLDNEFSIIELREQIPDLKVTYNDEDLLSQDKTIKVIFFTVRNEGADIHQNHYDINQPFGIKFNEAKVLKYSLISTSQDYLTDKFQNLMLDSSSMNTLIFPKTILDKNDFFSIKVYLLIESDEADS